MQITDLLASSLNRRDEEPNIELAKAIAAKNDQAAVTELVAVVQGKNKDWRSDAIKVLYETAALNPALVAGQISVFLGLLNDKNNRVQWGAMTALHAVAPCNPAALYDALPQIMDAADRGSVITRDHAVGILIELNREPAFTENAFSLLIGQLQSCPNNQLPMYAENALPTIRPEQKQLFKQALTDRLDTLEPESKKKRVEKVIRKIG